MSDASATSVPAPVAAPAAAAAAASDALTPAAARALASSARAASRALLALGYPARQAVLRAMADALSQPNQVAELLKANERDVSAAKAAAQAKTSGADAGAGAGADVALSASALARLELSSKKLATLATGLRQLADPSTVRDPVHRLLRETVVAEDLVLQQRSVPLGVLLVIFESRPDVLPQLAGLAVLSANGLLLKGGSESKHTLAMLHQMLAQAITDATDGKVDGRALVCLVQGRAAVGALLALDDCIDLCIPRGGSGLVSYVRANTRIPMLAHADGVCHVYVDADSGGVERLPDQCKLVVDAKTDYPAACNAMETLLMHEALLQQPGLPSAPQSAVHTLMHSLQEAGVTMLAGPNAVAHASAHGSTSPFHGLSPVASLHEEYGDLRCCVELVPSIESAVAHIHAHGSGHTECILTANQQTAEWFLQNVDAACVFHNASTRFADGQRMGLGAEVGISTARVHARGPVGVDGLCSTKWTLRSGRPQGHAVAPFSQGQEQYLHTSRWTA